MKLSYAITVCNESKDLYGLVSFLMKVKDQEDEINVLLDSLHATKPVRDVLNYFQKDIVVFERDFDGNFAEHRNYHLTKCMGDYIFIIDPDEMPKEKLLKGLKGAIKDSGAELLLVPRINLHPGFTQEWLNKCKFKVNEFDWKIGRTIYAEFSKMIPVPSSMGMRYMKVSSVQIRRLCFKRIHL